MYSEPTYKINNVEQIDNDIDDREEIDGIYKLSEIELTDKQKQQIIDERDVTMTDEIEIYDETVALTTDSGAYIADLEMIYPNILIGTIMTVASVILFFCVLLLSILMTDDTGDITLWWSFSLILTGLFFASITFLIICSFTLF
jgi:hypothetical protein